MVYLTEPGTWERQPTRNETLTVGTSSVEVTPTQPRKTIVIRNTSTSATAVITLNIGAKVAVANQGIVLRQYESFVDADDGGYKSFQGTITAICNEAGAQLSIFERN